MIKSGFVLLAAGRSSRFTGTVRKQFVEFSGKSVLRRALDQMPELESGVVVAPRKQIDGVRKRLSSVPFSGDLSVVPGGETRRQSVRLGLESFRSEPIDHVIVHDSARPLMPTEIHRRVLESLDSTVHGVVPVLPVDDTIKRVGTDSMESHVQETLERAHLRRVQTPQAFSFEEFYEVHQNWENDPVTDDAMMMESSGYTVATVPGSRLGRKITRREDLVMLRELSDRELT